MRRLHGINIHFIIVPGTIAFVSAEPQRQQKVVTTQSNDADDEDGLLSILVSIIVIVHMDFADDGCSDESDGEVKVELA